MVSVSVLVIITIAIAISFDVINGFHDAANSIATVVSTRVLKPQTAVLWAAFITITVDRALRSLMRAPGPRLR